MCTFGYRMGRIKNIFDIEIEACCFRVISLRWHLYSDIFRFDLIRFDFENYKKQCDNCKENKNLRELRELKSFIFLCTHSFRLSASCWLQFGCWFVHSFVRYFHSARLDVAVAATTILWLGTFLWYIVVSYPTTLSQYRNLIAFCLLLLHDLIAHARTQLLFSIMCCAMFVRESGSFSCLLLHIFWIHDIWHGNNLRSSEFNCIRCWIPNLTRTNEGRAKSLKNSHSFALLVIYWVFHAIEFAQYIVELPDSTVCSTV